MKVGIIAGSLPPQVCGVGDFTGALISAFRGRGIEVAVIHRDPWRISDIPGVLRELGRARPDVVHMQYPTHGFRRSLTPHMLHLCLTRRLRVTTLHDYNGQRWPVRTAMSVFACGGEVVMDAAPDRVAFVMRHPWMLSHMTRIPIGSNMPGGRWEPVGPFTVVHFGMLRPEKGLEEFIELARLSREADRPWRFLIVGAVVPHARNYAERLFHLAEGTGIEWRTGLGSNDVSETLRHAHAAFLAPTGGLHERRGTLLACAANGLPVIGKTDWATPEFLKDYVIAAGSPADALCALDLLSSSAEHLAAQSKRSVELDKMFSWDAIIDAYVALFEDRLGGRRNASRRGPTEPTGRQGQRTAAVGSDPCV
ncbi:MAG TPA: glycosyltransferase family 4 protein [Rhodopila sp.]